MSKEPSSGRKAIDFNLILFVTTARTEHGKLRNDYLTYRRFCSKRLHKLRRTLNMCHGKKKFEKRDLPEVIHDSRYLLFPLFNAERAWAYAMQIRYDERYSHESRSRYHMIRRLKKAVLWSKQLKEAVDRCATEKTQLEAEAYFHEMSGFVNLDYERWADAKIDFLKSKTVYEQLSSVGSTEARNVFKIKVEEITPTLRYCIYNLARMGESVGGEEENLYDILQSASDSVVDNLKSKIEEDELSFFGSSIPLALEGVKLALVRIGKFQEEIKGLTGNEDGNSQRILGMYDKILMHYAEALENAETESGEHLKLYLRWNLVQARVDRDGLMMRSIERSNREGSKIENKPEETVHLLDSLIQAASEQVGILEALNTQESKAAALKQEQLLILRRYQREYYYSCSFHNLGRFSEAFNLYNSALEAYGERRAKISEEDILAGFNDVVLKLKRGRLRLISSYELQQKGLTSEEVFKKSPANTPLLLEVDKIRTIPRIGEICFAPLPPVLEQLHCKPIFFDVASSYLEFPSMEPRSKPSHEKEVSAGEETSKEEKKSGGWWFWGR